MQRPIGVVLLAVGAGLAALYQLYMVLVYMGWISFEIVGQSVSYPDPQWGAALWTLLIAAIWAWVAIGFWNLRAYAISFGIFISLFTLVWAFFSLLFGNSVENQTIAVLLAGAIFLYLSYPGVQQAFVQNERSRLTPEQIAALEQLEAANQAAAAKPAPGMGKPENS
jgi:signal transduction histidine kinase